MSRERKLSLEEAEANLLRVSREMMANAMSAKTLQERMQIWGGVEIITAEHSFIFPEMYEVKYGQDD